MSTGYTYSRVINTSLSGEALLQALEDGDYVGIVQQGLALNQTPQFPLSVSGTVSASSIPSAQQLLQAANGGMPVVLSTASAANYINLGSDMPSVAAAYQSLFNLSTTSQSAILKFKVANSSNPSGYIAIQNNSGNSHNNVSVQYLGTNEPYQGLTPMYLNSLGSNLGDAAGAATISPLSGTVLRSVVVTGTDFSSGSQAVTFNVLAN